MDVVTTSLEALIQRATNPQNEKPDIAAIEAFCVMLGKESKGVHVASRLLSTHIQSACEKEALQALTVLDTCMKRCGRSFHAEVGKFRFLNVMIKLVSPKYLGNETVSTVRQRILDLLCAWTRDYPREVKIKETYEMLKKQGVIKESQSPANNIADCTVKSTKPKNPIFDDEETTKVLQELLQSTDPCDVRLANKLIMSMVEDDEKRVQQNSQRNMELEPVYNNVKLLAEMLDSYDSDKSSSEDIELMKELYDACERLKPTVTRLANECQGDDEMIGAILAANDELSQVLEKYTRIIVLKRGSWGGSISNNASTLLDFTSPGDIISQGSGSSNKKSSERVSNESKSDMEMLDDIFNTIENSLEPSSSNTDGGLVFSDTNIMQPISILPVVKNKGLQEPQTSVVKLDSKAKALEDLNQLGESLLKQSLSESTSVARNSPNNVSKAVKDVVLSGKSPTATLMYIPSTTNDTILANESNKDSQSIISSSAANGLGVNSSNGIDNDRGQIPDFVDLLNNDDDVMLDASFPSPQIGVDQSAHNDEKHNVERTSSDSLTDTVAEIKPLTDIHVTIDNIQPGAIPPLTVIEEKNGISVVLHFAKGSPREDVTVIVVTTMSKNSKALSNYLFQAVVPKKCKCRLQAPSGTEVPGHNPFLPPSAITQIMLIANPRKDPLSLKFMLSYTMDDETFTEMGVVDKLPTV